MHKLITILIASLILLPLVVSAAPEINSLTNNIATKAGYSSSEGTDRALPQQIGLIIQVALSLVGTIFLALTVYAGILWMTAQGNDDQVGKARKIIIAAVIGLVIALFGYVITGFVTSRLTGAKPSETNKNADTQYFDGGTCASPRAIREESSGSVSMYYCCAEGETPPEQCEYKCMTDQSKGKQICDIKT